MYALANGHFPPAVLICRRRATSDSYPSTKLFRHSNLAERTKARYPLQHPLHDEVSIHGTLDRQVVGASAVVGIKDLRKC